MTRTGGLAEAANTVARYICNVRQGEDVLLYADDGADPDIVEAIADACRDAGGETCVLWFGRRPVPDLEPPAPLAAAMKSTNVLIELAEMYLITPRPCCRPSCPELATRV